MGVLRAHDGNGWANKEPGPAGLKRFVHAIVLWFDSGVDLARGRAIRIRASGSWSNSGPPGVGPGGFAGYLYPGTILASAPLASLVGRVGESAFAVGSSFEGASPADGRLYLAINDTPDSFGDNQGALAVTIELP